MFSTRLTGVTSSRTDTGTVVSTHGKTKPREFLVRSFSSPDSAPEKF